MKPIDFQFTYKKQIGFTEIQHKTLIKLEGYNVNVCQFIRDAIKEKIQREWKQIKESKIKEYCPF